MYSVPEATEDVVDAFSQSFSPFRLPQRLGDRKPSTDSDLEARTHGYVSDTKGAWPEGPVRASPPTNQRLSARWARLPGHHQGSERLRVETPPTQQDGNTEADGTRRAALWVGNKVTGRGQQGACALGSCSGPTPAGGTLCIWQETRLVPFGSTAHGFATTPSAITAVCSL